MAEEYIYKHCTSCAGTGKEPSPHGGGNPDCRHCNGTGKIYWGNIQDEKEGEE